MNKKNKENQIELMVLHGLRQEIVLLIFQLEELVMVGSLTFHQEEVPNLINQLNIKNKQKMSQLTRKSKMMMKMNQKKLNYKKQVKMKLTSIKKMIKQINQKNLRIQQMKWNITGIYSNKKQIMFKWDNISINSKIKTNHFQ